jgi:hypothetical protein
MVKKKAKHYAVRIDWFGKKISWTKAAGNETVCYFHTPVIRKDGCCDNNCK